MYISSKRQIWVVLFLNFWGITYLTFKQIFFLNSEYVMKKGIFYLTVESF